jgi:hypothetical protein
MGKKIGYRAALPENKKSSKLKLLLLKLVTVNYFFLQWVESFIAQQGFSWPAQ